MENKALAKILVCYIPLQSVMKALAGRKPTTWREFAAKNRAELAYSASV
jgi:hypothetical protein